MGYGGREMGESDLAPTVSVVIPAHNEEPTIAEVVRACAANTPGLLEVIVVDDGSTDQTSAVARAAGADVLRIENNRGKGFALQRGIDRARGEILLFIDADGQDDPAEIPLLLSAFRPGIDLVLGSRFMGHFRPGAITRMNYLGTRFITGSVNTLFGIHVTDPLAGFRAVRKSVFESVRLEAKGYDIEVDVLLRVVRNGGGVAEVPASRSARPHGASGLSSVKDGTLILWRALQIRFARSPRPKRLDVAGTISVAESVAKPEHPR
jgi:glycosyltransferase involved in cell wall biosynthesis